jgi:co-chaperonin GroES (HSP10)
MPSLNIIPQNERVLAEIIEVKNSTKSGLVLTADNVDTISTTFATILAVADTIKEEFKKGDVIYFNARAGIQMPIAGKKFILLTKSEVLAKIETDDLSSIINSQDLT